MSELPAPHEREFIVGRAEEEARLRASLASGALSNGWLITGAKGAGKATLAYRLARALLEPEALSEPASLQVPKEARVFRFIAGRAHPDLFVAEREYDEKNERYATEISVETIRKLNAFLNRTASAGGWRVAIVDSADDLNRNAANALLKSLEEPPPKTAILLVANAPGRLLATIRSRCRRIDLRPVPPTDIMKLLESELGLAGEEAARLAEAAKGLPGLALSLAAGEGADAVTAASAFLGAARAGDDVGKLASALSGRQASEKWDVFQRIVLESLSDAARAAACGDETGLASLGAPTLLDAHQSISALFNRGEAVNADRAQMLAAAARIIRAASRGKAA